MGDPKRKLKGMLARIFSDAEVTGDEQAELETFLASGDLSQPEREEVFDDFVATTWKITNADGVVTDVERRRMREIVRVLSLSKERLPAAWAEAME